MMIMDTELRTYSELCERGSFDDRFLYLMLNGKVGKETFGIDRYINQRFYKDKPIYNWVLANPILYKKPILNVKGKLSFWEFEK